jgi:hypothetical protein
MTQDDIDTLLVALEDFTASAVDPKPNSKASVILYHVATLQSTISDVLEGNYR